MAPILEHYQDLINDNPNPTESKLVLVMEIDEAYYGKLGTQVPWLITVLTNLFRDQLDRYGELSTTRKLISKGLGCQADSNCKELAPSGRTFITCADDAMSMSLYRCHNGKILTFGTDAAAMKRKLTTVSYIMKELKFCALPAIICGTIPCKRIFKILCKKSRNG
ncbi:Uncharacterised protein [Chlamydia trachomatis]|nr:Uncharacterised protein [Chlamydia trachomatis]